MSIGYKHMEKIIGLDTSMKCTGYSIFHDDEYIESGTLVSNGKVKMEALELMTDNILILLNKKHPTTVVIEATVVLRNAEVQRKLTMIIGAVFGWCVDNNVKFEMLRPTEWRALISKEKKGRKRDELKCWSKNKVNELYGVKVNDDESDAILIAQAVLNKYKNENKLVDEKEI